jgi:uncharacterized protein YjbJ (UPF0337 family)
MGGCSAREAFHQENKPAGLHADYLAEKATKKMKEALGYETKETGNKASEAAGEARGKAKEMTGEAKERAEEVSSKMDS